MRQCRVRAAYVSPFADELQAKEAVSLDAIGVRGLLLTLTRVSRVALTVGNTSYLRDTFGVLYVIVK